MQEKSFKEKCFDETISLLKIFVVSFLAINLLTTFVVKPIKVIGDSMYPTLHHNDQGLSSVATKLTRGIKRFDIVVVYIARDNKYIVKRVIGLPNDIISYQNDQLYINHQIIEEDFLNENYINSVLQEGENFTRNLDPIQLGSDEYYLMGDNRLYSLDSTYYGPFKADQIISIGIFLQYPLH